jgi:hypothetical protein
MFDVLQPSVALIATFYLRGGLLYHFRNGSKTVLTAPKRHFRLTRTTDIVRPARLVRFVPQNEPALRERAARGAEPVAPME